MTLFELKNAEETLTKMCETKPIEIKLAFRLFRFIKKVQVELSHIEEMRQNLVNSLGVKHDDGSVQVPPEKMEEFFSEYSKILSEKSEIKEPIKFTLEELAQFSLSAKELFLIEPFISEQEDTTKS